MKKLKYLTANLMGALVYALLLVSCEKTYDLPTIKLSETQLTATPGNDITINYTITHDGGFKNLTIKKLWDGDEQSSQVVTDSDLNQLVYTVTEDDADHIVTLNFTVYDNQGEFASAETVITVELTPLQLLQKYNWRLDEEIRKKTNSNDISDVYNDDVYRFNSDGTYNKSIGAKVDDFSDIWFNYCFYDFNENTMRLLMSRTGAFGEEVTDTLNVTVIDDSKLRANINYYGLDQFDDSYDPVEEFEKGFVAVAKTDNFDPYLAGAEDDETGPAKMCADVNFDNN